MIMTVDFFLGKRFKESTEKYFWDTRIMVSKGMDSKRKYWISEKTWACQYPFARAFAARTGSSARSNLSIFTSSAPAPISFGYN